MSKIENAITYAINIAMDDSHGYDQINRYGPDFDCSSLLITSWNDGAGVPVKSAGATYTGNMRKAFVACGFRAIPYGKGTVLLRGDVLLNEKHHTAMYIGDGKIVQASINEKGGIYGGKSGDQTGHEIEIRNFYTYSKGWDYILRYEEKDKEEKSVTITMPVLCYGSKCAEVSLLQNLLNLNGYVGNSGKKLTIDSEWGKNTDHAVEVFQSDLKARGIINNIDHIIGEKSWNYLLHNQY